MRRTLAARGHLAVLLAALLVWHHTHVLWHLAGKHHTPAGAASPGLLSAPEHLHGHETDHPLRSAAHASGDHTHGAVSRKPYGHFGPLVHRLQHELAEAGFPGASREHFHDSEEPGGADEPAPPSHSHDSGHGSHGKHTAGDHLAGYYSGYAHTAPDLLTWLAVQAPCVDRPSALQPPFARRASARAPPFLS